jgi:Glycoside Hydrolase Family 113
MFNPFGLILNTLGLRNRIYYKLNLFLKNVVAKVRENFQGKITYASGTWEKVNWDLFDFIGIDHYRASYNKSIYVKQLTNYYKFNKPVAILEFGCCAYKGADDKGGAGWTITEIINGKPTIKGNYLRDESVQANYIIDLLNIFKNEKVYAAFVFTFINPIYKHSTDPKFDLDMASYGIVKPVNYESDSAYKGLGWTPKKAFYSLSDFYKKL